MGVSADGNTLAVGAMSEDSGATGVNGDQNDNSQQSSGAVYVFTRSGQTWSQQAYIKASNTRAGDEIDPVHRMRAVPLVHISSFSADGVVRVVGQVAPAEPLLV